MSIEYVDADLSLELLVPEATLLLLDHLHVPADKVFELGLEIAEVLIVLGDEICVRVGPLRHVLHLSLVLLDLFMQLGSSDDGEVFLDTESRDIDCWTRVDRCLESNDVRVGVLEVWAKVLAGDNVGKLSLSVAQMVNVGRKVRVIRLEQLGIATE